MEKKPEAPATLRPLPDPILMPEFRALVFDGTVTPEEYRWIMAHHPYPGDGRPTNAEILNEIRAVYRNLESGVLEVVDFED